jgi:hypothetical protein
MFKVLVLIQNIAREREIEREREREREREIPYHCFSININAVTSNTFLPPCGLFPYDSLLISNFFIL